MKNKYLCIIQARMGSTRLPGKVLKKVGRLSLLGYELLRVKQSKKIDKIVVATGLGRANNPIIKECVKYGVDSFRGSENDVLSRYYECAKNYPEYSTIVRITGDCPLIDPRVVDEVIDMFEKGKYDYAANVLKETFPDGMDIEVFTRQALKVAHEQAAMNSEREHVTLFIRRHKKFKKGNFVAPADFSQFRFTVDNREDLAVVKFLVRNSATTAGYLDYISLLSKNLAVLAKNIHIKRNQGLAKSLREDFKIK